MLQSIVLWFQSVPRGSAWCVYGRTGKRRDCRSHYGI